MEWLSIGVTFGAALIFGMLARRSPQKNWDFIKGWPAFVLFIISGTMSQMEFAQKQYERNVPRCEFILTDEGFECEPIITAIDPSEGPLTDSLDWVKSTFVSVLLDAPAEILGMALGMGSLKKALHT